MKHWIFLLIIICSAEASAAVTQPLACVSNVDSNGNLCTEFTVGPKSGQIYDPLGHYTLPTQDGVTSYGTWVQAYGNFYLQSDPSNPGFALSLNGCTQTAWGTTFMSGTLYYSNSFTYSCLGGWTGTVIINYQRYRVACSGRGSGGRVCYGQDEVGGSGTLSLPPSI